MTQTTANGSVVRFPATSWATRLRVEIPDEAGNVGATRAWEPPSLRASELKPGVTARRPQQAGGRRHHPVYGTCRVTSNDAVTRLAEALDAEQEHFREFRLRVISECAWSRCRS